MYDLSRGDFPLSRTSSVVLSRAQVLGEHVDQGRLLGETYYICEYRTINSAQTRPTTNHTFNPIPQPPPNTVHKTNARSVSNKYCSVMIVGLVRGQTGGQLKLGLAIRFLPSRRFVLAEPFILPLLSSPSARWMTMFHPRTADRYPEWTGGVFFGRAVGVRMMIILRSRNRMGERAPWKRLSTLKL